jgi:hypothetical protein
MYQVFCMQGTPPVTWEEQDRCMHSKSGCWRLAKEATCGEAAQKKQATQSTASSTSR